MAEEIARMRRRHVAAAGGAALLLPVAARAQGTRPVADRAASFRTFWRSFRAAVLADDMAAVVRLSRLPVESRGELDDEPVRRLTAATLPAAFRRLLRTVEDVERGRTVLQRVRDTPEPVLDAAELAVDQARVGSLAFARGRDGWRLVTLYRGPEE